MLQFDGTGWVLQDNAATKRQVPRQRRGSPVARRRQGPDMSGLGHPQTGRSLTLARSRPPAAGRGFHRRMASSPAALRGGRDGRCRMASPAPPARQRPSPGGESPPAATRTPCSPDSRSVAESAERRAMRIAVRCCGSAATEQTSGVADLGVSPVSLRAAAAACTGTSRSPTWAATTARSSKGHRVSADAVTELDIIGSARQRSVGRGTTASSSTQATSRAGPGTDRYPAQRQWSSLNHVSSRRRALLLG